jgi:hypothetical protein
VGLYSRTPLPSAVPQPRDDGADRRDAVEASAPQRSIRISSTSNTSIPRGAPAWP